MSAAREFLYRRNAVLEALRSRRRVCYTLWLQQGLPRAEAAPFLSLAQQRGLAWREATKERLGQLAGDRSHQGVALEVGAFPYADVDAILALSQARGEAPFLLLLDLVQGPQNVGMLLRSAEACGVHGVVIQQRRAPDITPAMVAASAGATEHLLIAQVTNLVSTLRQLKRADVWLVGLDLATDAKTPAELDLNMALGLVVGHEGSGLRRLVREECDFLLRLPMRGQVASLNASVAGSIALYLAWRARV